MIMELIPHSFGESYREWRSRRVKQRFLERKDGGSEMRDIRLTSPLEGELIPLSAVKDMVFSTGAMGRGAAVRNPQGKVVALVNYMSQILVELIKLANLIITVTKAVACSLASARPSVPSRYHHSPAANSIATVTQASDQPAASFSDTRCCLPPPKANRSTSSIVTTMAAKAAHIHHVPIDSIARSAQKQKGPVPDGHRPWRASMHGPCPSGKVSLATNERIRSLPPAPGDGPETHLPY